MDDDLTAAQIIRDLSIEIRDLWRALDIAKAALHHCDIRHKKCSCSKEAIEEIERVFTKE